MHEISFIISTGGTNDDLIRKAISSIEKLNIPRYEVIIVGGMTTTVNQKNTYHIPFYEQEKFWTTKKKNLGSFASHYENLVIMHDYYEFDLDWYEQFVNFGLDWDIQVQQNFILPELGGYRYNGWRVDTISGYPEIPWNMAIPWDIDHFLPYCAIQGSFWVIKRKSMLSNPLDESLFTGQCEDIEWSSRVVPGWMGKIEQTGLKIVANPNCVSRLTNNKTVHPCGPDQNQISESLNWLWDEIRENKIRPGVVYYDKKLGRAVRA